MLPVIIVIIVGIVCIVISVAGMKRTEETDTESNTAEINRITDEYELNEEEIAVLQRRVSEMKRNEMSIMEIAKELGLGVGEVKLVVDLYQGEAK